MGSGKRHAASAVAAREGRSAFPRSALEPLLSKRKVPVLFYNLCVACEADDRVDMERRFSRRRI
jgi:hypothetical protein